MTQENDQTNDDIRVIDSTAKVSERDLQALRRMILTKKTMTQTRCRRIRIWRTLGREGQVDAQVVWDRTYPSGVKERKVNVLRLSVPNPGSC